MKTLIVFLVFVLWTSVATAQQSTDILETLGNSVSEFQKMDPSSQSGVLSSTGLSSMPKFSWPIALAWVIFGAVGFVAFIYGKKMQNYKVLAIGVTLMGYQYFVTNVWGTYIVGTILCVALYIFWE